MEITREEWQERYFPQGKREALKVTVQDQSVEVETEDGGDHIHVDVYLDEGVDFRCNDIQVIICKQRIAVVQKHPPYPVKRWTVLWEGEMATTEQGLAA